VETFPEDVMNGVEKEREARLTTYGRKTGKPTTVTIWIVADDAHRVFIRSGKGLVRHWPQNLLKRPEGELKLGKTVVRFKSRHVTDPAEARHSSSLYGPKYGPSVQPSKAGDPLTLGEQAAFELRPFNGSP
jgi:deazaflavin-dependent oxidoreductase (nitroreductase family)